MVYFFSLKNPTAHCVLFYDIIFTLNLSRIYKHYFVIYSFKMFEKYKDTFVISAMIINKYCIVHLLEKNNLKFKFHIYFSVKSAEY